MRAEQAGDLRVRLLGAVEATTASGRVALGPSLRTVLAALAVDAGRVVDAAVLVDRVWGGADRRPADSTVHSAVSRVRAALDATGAPGAVRTRAPGYQLVLAPDALDAARFEHLLGAARVQGRDDPAGARRTVGEALALWHGPALADVDVPFAREEARRLEDRRLEALELRARTDLALGRHREAVADLTDLVVAHPWHEDLRAALALALYRSSRQAEALGVLDEGRRLLGEELGLDPAPELRRLRDLVLRQDPALDAPADTGPSVAVAAAVPAPATPGRTAPPTDLVGRHEEVRRLVQRLRDARLLTLTGTGGVGKTRLAEAVVDAARADFPGGTWFVPLATLTRASAVLPTTARAVGLSTADGDVVDALARRFAGPRSLLVLDNCEHLLEAAADVAALVRRCPDLHVLTTSRAPLRVGAEVEHRVDPLDADAARELFVRRARAVAPDVLLDDRAGGPVDAVCRALAGLPLALELAAAKVRVLGVDDLLARLDQALAGGARDLPERQRTLRATLDWSCGLLDDPARTLFARLGVFAGGWTLAELEALVEGVVEGEESTAVLPALEALVEHSLVTVERTGTAAGLPVRYGMLEPVRQHARRALSDQDAAPVVLAHARAYLDLAERATAAYRGPAQVEWLHRMDLEHPNVLAAVDGALAAGEADLAGRLVWASWLFWWMRGLVGTGRRCAEAVAATGSQARAGRHDRGLGGLPSTLGRVRALTALGAMAFAQGDPVAARAAWTGALAEAETVTWDHEQDRAEAVAQCEAGQGICSLVQGDLDAAAAAHRRAIALAAPLPADSWGPWIVRLNHVWWGTGAWRAGRTAQARELVTTGLALARAAGDRLATYLALFNLALVEADVDPGRAAAALLEGLRLSEQTRDRANLAHVLDALVVLLQPRTAPAAGPDLAFLLGAAAQAREDVGFEVYAFYPRDPVALAAAASAVAGTLPAHQLQQATARGRSAGLAEVVATADRAAAAVVGAVVGGVAGSAVETLTVAPGAAPRRPS